MSRVRFLVVVALAGALVALAVVIDTNRSATTATVAPPSVPPPFRSFVVGTGLTENARGNVEVGTTVSGVVKSIDVRVGDRVAVGQPLFHIDDRDLLARRAVAVANLGAARAALEKPRHRLDFMTKERAVSASDVSAAAMSDARDDFATAESAAESARAMEAQIGVDIDRLVVRAPGAGRVLRIDTRVGEFAENGAATPLMLLGDDTRMFLRVNVDENDAWRVRPRARAIAFLRGNPRISVALRYEYTEPYITPKPSLTGQPTERPDQRVLQVVYSFEPHALPIYLGQQMDAYIEAAPDPDKARGD